MNYRELSGLLVKVAGAVIIINALSNLPAFVAYYYSLNLPKDSLLAFLGMTILPMMIPLLAGAVLFMAPQTITNNIIGGDPSAAHRAQSVEVLELVALSVLGVYLLFRAMSDMIYHGSMALLYTSQSGGHNPIAPDTIASAIATIFELAFAVILLFGASKFVAMLRRVRRANS